MMFQFFVYLDLPQYLMLLMEFNRLPTLPIYDTRSFYHGEPCTNRASCIAISKKCLILSAFPILGRLRSEAMN